MIRIIAILLSNLVLLQSLHIDFKDINKVSALIDHAQFHQEKYGDSFVEFLYDHYIDQEIALNQNHKEHQDLPFKQGVNHFNHLVSILEINPTVFKLRIPNNSFSKKNFFYKESYSESVKPAIFQPPKFA
ncbi:hypothetical protein IU405_03835 [Polaribacter sp. BAL334]|uniref:hypothetical protein n=1 Tax=Polaribacter sp. BAL334 TaxID=1708178 RepID=UPI0018D2582B|nr:hypothetical protein [Polaribacter sp. BAL334]MBG7611373.1 hypothetical protein [Polaribacter sp. BAL334]